MYDGTLPFEGSLQRAAGDVRVSIGARDGGSVLDRLYQAGAAKARLPKTYNTSGKEVVLINTAGGLTGGDRFSVDVGVGAEAHAVVTTQTCERVYKSLELDAIVGNKITVGADGHIDWVPQETIFFNGGALRRTLTVDLHDSASAFLLEPVVFGRKAMGETVHEGRYIDQWRVHVEGTLVFADNARLDHMIDGTLGRLGVGRGWSAFAAGLYVGPDGLNLRDRIREIPEEAGIEFGTSLVRGVVVLRVVASDSQRMRRWIEQVYHIVAGRALPRAWYC